MPRLPWFGWAVVAFVVLNVLLDRDVSILPLIVIGVVLASVLGRPRPGARRPVTPPPGASSGGPVLTGQPPPAVEPGMPTIDVPRYPGSVGTAHPGPVDPPPPPPGPAGGVPATDPVVSLGQLSLARCAQDLDAAARAGDDAEVARTLREIIEVGTRLLPMVDGAGGRPGSGLREFGAGLRRLQREAEAALEETPPGPRVAQVVRGATSMGQTGRHE